MFEFFCNECQILFCAKCVMVHQRHDYIDIESATSLVQQIRSNCLEAVSLVEANSRESVKRLKRIYEARNQHEVQIAQSVEDLRNDYIGRHKEVNAKYYEEVGRVKREFMPLSEYLDRHEDAQQRVLAKKEKELSYAEAIKQELMEADSNLAVLVKVQRFCYKTEPEDAFEFNTTLFMAGSTAQKSDVSIEEKRWSDMYQHKVR
jgi:hypothetical protein